MAQLTVRNVSDEVAAALKARSAGRSAEAEHRRILEEALRPAAGPDFFAAARERRVRLLAGVPDTADPAARGPRPATGRDRRPGAGRGRLTVGRPPTTGWQRALAGTGQAGRCRLLTDVA